MIPRQAAADVGGFAGRAIWYRADAGALGKVVRVDGVRSGWLLRPASPGPPHGWVQRVIWDLLGLRSLCPQPSSERRPAQKETNAQSLQNFC